MIVVGVLIENRGEQFVGDQEYYYEPGQQDQLDQGK
jgi:hypothetical protein